MPSDPIEATTLASTLDRLRSRGFTASFEVADGQLRVAGSDRAYRPGELTIREHYRFEGASDPGDMSVVYALEAADGTRGVLVDAFGTYADPEVGEVLGQIAVDHHGATPSTRPPGVAPRRSDAA